MKILKQGNLELLKETKRFVCKYCHCAFEADKGEYKAISQYNETDYQCQCPCCKHYAYEDKANHQ